MSDNRRQYRTIRKALQQLYPEKPQGNLARHLNSLAMLISGIVASRSSRLPDIARKVPDGNKKESRVKRFYRWLKNERISAQVYFMPYLIELLTSLASHQTLLLAIDGSEVGRGCMALMIHVIYRNRALPLVWLVVEQEKGHLPETLHCQLVKQVQALIPETADVIFVGDGEFDGCALQALLQSYAWGYVCRTAKSTQIHAEGDTFALDSLDVYPGLCQGLPEVGFTTQAYGPVLVILWWEHGYQEPLYLVSNLELTDEACYWYRRRYRIETFFSDQKSRGFNLHKSHISDPQRLARLLIAACLAYIWIIYLGVQAHVRNLVGQLHRTDRCDLSLFRLGLELLEYLLNEDLDIPVSFVPPPKWKSVR